ncbi:ErpL protein [Borreliella tanukii]|uniref:ErpL protein n=1 Tax=Borreliella tanukii TaxID=56146 RepID=UPI003CC9201C
MKKKVFVICVVFALIISCKNYVNGKDLETSEQSLEIPKQIEQEIKKEFNELLNILEIKDISKLDAKDTKEIEKQIQELKNKIDKSDAKTTSLLTYSGYEKKVQEIREKLKNKGNLEGKLKELEDSLKNKKEERKKALEDAKTKFEGYKRQVDSATGETYGAQVGNQRGGGQQAWKEAKDLGLNVSYSNDTDTSDMSSGIIEGALKKIEEELNNSIEDFREDKKE